MKLKNSLFIAWATFRNERRMKKYNWNGQINTRNIYSKLFGFHVGYDEIKIDKRLGNKINRKQLKKKKHAKR